MVKGNKLEAEDLEEWAVNSLVGMQCVDSIIIILTPCQCTWVWAVLCHNLIPGAAILSTEEVEEVAKGMIPQVNNADTQPKTIRDLLQAILHIKPAGVSKTNIQSLIYFINSQGGRQGCG